jgi:putative FmdB family regulatory protein
MPTYEYGCEACGNEWEEVQRITEPPREVCPKCGKTAAHRLISAGTNFILKGGGWYSDLYSSPKGGAKKVDSNGGTTSDASKPDKPDKADKADRAEKAETKSEAKTESKPSTTATTPAASGGSTT